MLLVFLSAVMLAVHAQDCKTYGKECGDHEQCCGGCCFYGQCIDTYRSCLQSPDVCDDHTCMGQENCVPYMPPECPGCEPIPICKIT